MRSRIRRSLVDRSVSKTVADFLPYCLAIIFQIYSLQKSTIVFSNVSIKTMTPKLKRSDRQFYSLVGKNIHKLFLQIVLSLVFDFVTSCLDSLL